MIEIYGGERDWMNYRIVRDDLTYHHIIKRCDGGRETIDNGALLMKVPHEYLHLIEFKDFKSYKHLNQVFRLINDQRHDPTPEQRETVEYILQEFEYRHRNDRNSKGKRLIKDKYLCRQHRVDISRVYMLLT